MHSQPFPAPAHKVTAHSIYWSQERAVRNLSVRSLPLSAPVVALQGPRVLALRAGAGGRNQTCTRLLQGAALGAASPAESLLAAAAVIWDRDAAFPFPSHPLQFA